MKAPARDTTGKAFINFVDATGMKAGLLTVAPVQRRAPGAAEFEELRAHILDASPSSARIDAARAHVADRRRALTGEAEKLRSREPASPEGYRERAVAPIKSGESKTGYLTSILPLMLGCRPQK